MALSVFLMLVTWRETRNQCAQPVSAKNSLKLVRTILGPPREETRILYKKISDYL